MPDPIVVGAPPTPVDLIINGNSSFTMYFTWKTKPSDPDAPSSPIPLAGWEALMQVKDESNSDTILFEASTRNGKIVLHPTNGRVTIKFSATDTADMAFINGKYDLLMKAPNGDIKRPLRGSITVLKGVSKFDPSRI